MASIVLTTLSVFLGFFFIFVGSVKVSQQISKDMHREIRRNFVQYAKVFPFANTLGLKVSSKYLRLSVGWTEIIAGFLLVFIPGIVKQISNIILLCITLGALYTHYMIDDKFERTAPAIVFSLMLICRLIVYYQVKRRERSLKKDSPQINQSYDKKRN